MELFTQAELDEIEEDYGESCIMVGTEKVKRLVEHARELIRLKSPGMKGLQQAMDDYNANYPAGTASKSRVRRSEVIRAVDTDDAQNITRTYEKLGYEPVGLLAPPDCDHVWMHFRQP